MNTTTKNFASVPTDIKARWGFEAPARPVVALEHFEDFFSNANEDTIIEYWDDLYKRSHSGEWTHMGELISNHWGDGSEHPRSTPAEMIAMIHRMDIDAPVYVLATSVPE